jgi:hypothetical protein
VRAHSVHGSLALVLCGGVFVRAHGVHYSLVLVHRGGLFVRAHGIHGSLALVHCDSVCVRAHGPMAPRLSFTVVVCLCVRMVSLAPWLSFAVVARRAYATLIYSEAVQYKIFYWSQQMQQGPGEVAVFRISALCCIAEIQPVREHIPHGHEPSTHRDCEHAQRADED